MDNNKLDGISFAALVDSKFRHYQLTLAKFQSIATKAAQRFIPKDGIKRN